MWTEKLMTKNFLFVRKNFSRFSLARERDTVRKLWKILNKNHMLAHGNCLTSSIHVLSTLHSSDDAVKIFHVNKKKSLSLFSRRWTMLCNHLQIAHMRLSLIYVCGVLLIGTIHSSNTPSSLLFSFMEIENLFKLLREKKVASSCTLYGFIDLTPLYGHHHHFCHINGMVYHKLCIDFSLSHTHSTINI